jgi:hypothetical protein
MHRSKLAVAEGKVIAAAIVPADFVSGFALACVAMVRYEPPYVVYMLENEPRTATGGEGGLVYSSGNPSEAEAFAASLYDTGASVVEVRDSTGQLVRRFSRAPAPRSDG